MWPAAARRVLDEYVERFPRGHLATNPDVSAAADQVPRVGLEKFASHVGREALPDPTRIEPDAGGAGDRPGRIVDLEGLVEARG